jgi:site-specific recombinase XerD
VKATPLLAHTNANEPLSSARIYEILKDAFVRCAVHLEATDARAAVALRKASTHWLRHTYGTHAIARKVALTVVQGNMGHAAITTTQKYLTAEDAVRARATRDAFGTQR